MTVLLFAYGTDAASLERSAPTRDWLSRHEEWLARQGVTIARLGVTDEGPRKLSRYEKAIRLHWGQAEDLMVLEHDIVPIRPAIQRMLRCPHGACAHDYRLWREYRMYFHTCPVHRQEMLVSPLLRAEVSYRVWNDPESPARFPVWGRGDEEFAALAGLGLTRFRASFMQAHPGPWKEGGWNDIDSRISEYLDTRIHPFPFHIHHPQLKHRHSKKIKKWSSWYMVDGKRFNVVPEDSLACEAVRAMRKAQSRKM